MEKKIEIISLLKKRFLSTSLMLGVASFAFAQEKQNISGKVVNASGEPIPYVSIVFKNVENHALSDGVLTDEKGSYHLSLASGNYSIEIDAIGYRKFSKNYTVKTEMHHFNDFVLELEDKQQTKTIKEVVITASSKPYKVELDKKTYDVSSDIVSKGGSLKDLLQNVPSVDVDTEGNVSMRGTSNVKFLINGKPSALLGIGDGVNALQSIPSDQIDRIEVITNPSSKFEASGTSGILNIILKKSKKSGFNGNTIGSLGYSPKTNLNANLSWKKGDWTWFLNGGGGYNRGNKKSSSDNYYKNLNSQNQLLEAHQNETTKIDFEMYNATGGILYNLGDRTSLSLSGTVRTFKSNEKGTIDYDYLYNSLLLPNPYTKRNTIGNKKDLSLQGDLGIDHTFADSKEHKIATSISWQSRNEESNSNISQESNNKFDSKFIASSYNTDMSYLFNHNDQKTKKNSVIAKIDYELPIGDHSKFEVGYRMDFNKNHYENTADEQKNATYHLLRDFTNKTEYDERFHSLYIQFKSKIDRFGYQLGLRDEFSNVTIDYQNLSSNQVNKTKKYNGLFPSVYLSYDLDGGNQLLLNYSRRIDRPKGFFMVPYFSLTDDQNIFRGNLDLNPSYINLVELGYSFKSKKLMLNPTVYFSHKTDDDKVITFREDESSNVFYNTPINEGTKTRYGLDLNATLDVSSWLRFMASVDLFGYQTQGNYTYQAKDGKGNIVNRSQSFDGKGFSTRVRLNTTLKFANALTMQIQGGYRGKENSGVKISRAEYDVNLGISKTVLDGNGTIGFNIQDIFNSRSMRRTTISESSTHESFMQFQPRQFSLSFSYRFSQGAGVNLPRNKKGGGDEVKYSEEQQIAL